MFTILLAVMVSQVYTCIKTSNTLNMCKYVNYTSVKLFFPKAQSTSNMTSTGYKHLHSIYYIHFVN